MEQYKKEFIDFMVESKVLKLSLIHIYSYVIAALVVVLTLGIGILASYAFSRFDFPGKSRCV